MRSFAREGEKQRLASALGGALLLALLGFAIVIGVAAVGSVAVPPWASYALLAGLVSILAFGVFAQSSGVFARPLVAVRTDRPEVALTFDDGPDPKRTCAILDLLEARGHRGTFFLIGRRALEYRSLVKEIARREHGLGNHSFDHSYLLTFRSPDDLAADLIRTSAVIKGATGRQVRWFRPPVGILSPRIAAAARLAKLDLVAWTASARDGAASCDPDRAVTRLARHLAPGSILVLHDGAMKAQSVPRDLTILEAVLDRLEARGLRSVTLDRLLDAPKRP